MENTDSLENVCLVCHEPIEIYAVGKCDHPICYKCSTRMRVLCEQKYCPICRTVLPEVCFLLKVEKFEDIPLKAFIADKKWKILFENNSIHTKFDTLMEYRCSICKEQEKSFKALRDHFRRVHTMFYCDLCLELKIFPSERKLYNRKSLASHKRMGDKDDTSYKSHPNCQFCDQRYLDKDELYKHLRKDHYYCHFCESLGSQEFYSDYGELKKHFRADHYLCEQDDCEQAQFVNAFRTDIDLKGHQANHHSKAQSKSEARQERKLNIDINLVPRPSSRAKANHDDYERQSRGSQYRDTRGGKVNMSNGDRPLSDREKADMDRAIQASLSTMREDVQKNDTKGKKYESNLPKECIPNIENFPSLDGSRLPITSVSAATAVSNSKNDPGSLAERSLISMGKLVRPEMTCLEDFPLLEQSDEKRVNPQNGIYSTPFTSKSLHPQKSRTVNTEEDFPELSVTNKNVASVHCTWIKPDNMKVKESTFKQQSKSTANLSSKVKEKSDLSYVNAFSNPVSNSNQYEHNQPNVINSKSISDKQTCSKNSIANTVKSLDSSKNEKRNSKKKKQERDLPKGQPSLGEIASSISNRGDHLDNSEVLAKNETEKKHSQRNNSSVDDAMVLSSGSDRLVKTEKHTRKEFSKPEKKENKNEQKIDNQNINRSNQGVQRVHEIVDEFPILGHREISLKKDQSGFRNDYPKHEQRSGKKKENANNDTMTKTDLHSGSGSSKKSKAESNGKKNKNGDSSFGNSTCSVSSPSKNSLSEKSVEKDESKTEIKVANKTEPKNVKKKYNGTDEKVLDEPSMHEIAKPRQPAVFEDEFPLLENKGKVNKNLPQFKMQFNSPAQWQKQKGKKEETEILKLKEANILHESSLTSGDTVSSLYNGVDCDGMTKKTNKTESKIENLSSDNSSIYHATVVLPQFKMQFNSPAQWQKQKGKKEETEILKLKEANILHESSLSSGDTVSSLYNGVDCDGMTKKTNKTESKIENLSSDNSSIYHATVVLSSGSEQLDKPFKPISNHESSIEVKTKNMIEQKIVNVTDKNVPMQHETPCHEIVPETLKVSIAEDEFPTLTLNELSKKKYPPGLKNEAVEYSAEWQTLKTSKNIEKSGESLVKPLQKISLSLDGIANALFVEDTNFGRPKTSQDKEIENLHKNCNDDYQLKKTTSAVNVLGDETAFHEDSLVPKSMVLNFTKNEFPLLGDMQKGNKPPPGFRQETVERNLKYKENYQLNNTEDVVRVLGEEIALHDNSLVSESVKLIFNEEEFPSLEIMKNGKKPPPGFRQEALLISPPVLIKDCIQKPPPGFSSQIASPLIQQAIVQSFPSATNFNHYPPDSTQDRNLKLINIIQSFCEYDNEKYNNFMTISQQFKNSEISAQCYYQKCEELLGKSNFAEIFLELVALLPDSKKQQELHSVAR